MIAESPGIIDYGLKWKLDAEKLYSLEEWV